MVEMARESPSLCKETVIITRALHEAGVSSDRRADGASPDKKFRRVTGLSTLNHSNLPKSSRSNSCGLIFSLLTFL